MARHLILEPACEKALERLIQEPSQRLSGLVAEWRSDRIVLDFEHGRQALSPGEAAISGEDVVLIAAPEGARRRRPRKRPVDWYGMGVLTLMLASAAAAMASLLSAVSP